MSYLLYKFDVGSLRSTQQSEQWELERTKLTRTTSRSAKAWFLLLQLMHDGIDCQGRINHSGAYINVRRGGGFSHMRTQNFLCPGAHFFSKKLTTFVSRQRYV